LGFLALCYALQGDLASAQAWSAAARRRAERYGGGGGLHWVAEAVIQCRRGEHVEAESLLALHWSELERMVAPGMLRAARIVRALALASRRPADEGSAALWIEGARPSRDGEFRYLGAHWPEMARYLDAHGAPRAGPTT
jgi:hypothetical protein